MSCFPGTRGPSGVSYTVPVSESVPGESAILRGKNGVAGLYVGSDDVRTCADIFRRGMKEAGADAPCLGGREMFADGSFGEYQWLSYGEVDSRIGNISSGLVNLDLVPETVFGDESQQGGKFRFLCCYSKNRVEWNLLELASNLQAVTVVPMYDTLGLDGLKFITEQTSLQTIACSSQTIKHVIALKSQHPGSSVQSVILFEHGLSPNDFSSLREQAKAVGLRVFSLSEVEQAGKEKKAEESRGLRIPCVS